MVGGGGGWQVAVGVVTVLRLDAQSGDVGYLDQLVG